VSERDDRNKKGERDESRTERERRAAREGERGKEREREKGAEGRCGRSNRFSRIGNVRIRDSESSIVRMHNVSAAYTPELGAPCNLHIGARDEFRFGREKKKRSHNSPSEICKQSAARDDRNNTRVPRTSGLFFLSARRIPRNEPYSSRTSVGNRVESSPLDPNSPRLDFVRDPLRDSISRPEEERRNWRKAGARRAVESFDGGRCTAVTRPTAVSAAAVAAAGRSIFLSISLFPSPHTCACVCVCAARVYRYVDACYLSSLFLPSLPFLSLSSLLRRFRRPSD